MDQRLFRGCRRSLSMWREATGRYCEPPEEEEVERVESDGRSRLGLRAVVARLLRRKG
jgi:hypothetical protein